MATMVLSPTCGYHVDKPSLISQLEQEDKVMTEERGILPGTCPDLETVLKAKWLTPKKHVFRKEHSNGVKVVRLTCLIAVFSQ
eukprot:bmy_11757T0